MYCFSLFWLFLLAFINALSFIFLIFFDFRENFIRRNNFLFYSAELIEIITSSTTKLTLFYICFNHLLLFFSGVLFLFNVTMAEDSILFIKLNLSQPAVDHGETPTIVKLNFLLFGHFGTRNAISTHLGLFTHQLKY